MRRRSCERFGYGNLRDESDEVIFGYAGPTSCISAFRSRGIST